MKNRESEVPGMKLTDGESLSTSSAWRGQWGNKHGDKIESRTRCSQERWEGARGLNQLGDEESHLEHDFRGRCDPAQGRLIEKRRQGQGRHTSRTFVRLRDNKQIAGDASRSGFQEAQGSDERRRYGTGRNLICGLSVYHPVRLTTCR